MHLLYITNDSYVPHVAATICSVFENNREMHFDVHIIGTDVTEENEARLRKFVEGYGHGFQIIKPNPDELEIDLGVCGKWGIYPSLKLYAADFFPDVDRMLYMDADMICLGSLKAIEELDMEDWCVAASPDEEASSLHKARLGMRDDEFYGCAGLMYFNLENWRKEEMRKRCFEFFNAPENHDRIKIGEQDVINYVCRGSILPLGLQYNMFSHYWLHHGRAIPRRYMEQWTEYRKSPVIVHFIDACKPWFSDCRFAYKREYHRYAAMTPWGDQNWGHSPMYEGFVREMINSVKVLLHRIGVKKNDYAYDK